MRRHFKILELFDRFPYIVAAYYRIGKEVLAIAAGPRGDTAIHVETHPPVQPEDTLAVVQSLYPDPDSLEWGHFRSGGHRTHRLPPGNVIVTIFCHHSEFELWYHRVPDAVQATASEE